MRILSRIIFMSMMLGFSHPTAANADTWSDLTSTANQMWEDGKKYVEEKYFEYTGKRLGVAEIVPQQGRAPASQPAVATAPVVPMPAMPQEKVTAEQQQQMSNYLNQSSQVIKSTSPYAVTNPGRPADPQIPVNKAGIPRIERGELVKVTAIPLLNLGEEPQISRNQFALSTPILTKPSLKSVKPLEAPQRSYKKELQAWLLKKIPKPELDKIPKSEQWGLVDVVSQEKIDRASAWKINEDPMISEMPFVNYSKDQLQMLSALILYGKGERCHIIAGILDELSRKEEFAQEANLYLGVCAHQMGFHSDSVNRLLKVIPLENEDYTAMAVKNIVENLPREYEMRVGQVLRNIKNTSLIPEESKDNFNYIISKGAYQEEKYSISRDYAEKVSSKSPHYYKAQFVYSTSLYALNKNSDALKAFDSLRNTLIQKKSDDKDLMALINLNIARIKAVDNQYKAALADYAMVAKDHPLWVQGLVEQGWAQLMSDDSEGAIGNMYSLHSPYFKSIYKPDSYVVRTIGYINICQFGDAYKTLASLENKYRPWISQIDHYLANKKDPVMYYNTVKNYLKGKSDASIDGLPFQVIREVGRQRDFLNFQDSLNLKEDEIAQYQFIEGMIKQDKAKIQWKMSKARERLAQLQQDLIKAKTDKSLVKNISAWQGQVRTEKTLIDSYSYQVTLYEEARQSYLRFRARTEERIDKEKLELKIKAGKSLQASLKNLKDEAQRIFENNEFLRYEIFAGSGENIRFMVAKSGGEDTRRIASEVKPQKIMNWDFDGEYWEDEIGNYRSSLKNNCNNVKKTMLDGQAASGSGKQGEGL